MEIMLGCFGDAYRQLHEIKGFLTYYEFSGLYRITVGGFTKILLTVENACDKCTHIHFLLDKMWLPLGKTNNLTPRELQIVTSRKDFIAKTTFWLNGEVVDKQRVLQIISDINAKGRFAGLL